MFARGAKSDINLKAAFAHMAADALVSLGVAIAGGLMLVTRLRAWLDPLASLLISGRDRLGDLGPVEGVAGHGDGRRSRRRRSARRARAIWRDGRA